MWFCWRNPNHLITFMCLFIDISNCILFYMFFDYCLFHMLFSCRVLRSICWNIYLTFFTILFRSFNWFLNCLIFFWFRDNVFFLFLSIWVVLNIVIIALRLLSVPCKTFLNYWFVLFTLSVLLYRCLGLYCWLRSLTIVINNLLIPLLRIHSCRRLLGLSIPIN